MAGASLVVLDTLCAHALLAFALAVDCTRAGGGQGNWQQAGSRRSRVRGAQQQLLTAGTRRASIADMQERGKGEQSSDQRRHGSADCSFSKPRNPAGAGPGGGAAENMFLFPPGGGGTVTGARST